MGILCIICAEDLGKKSSGSSDAAQDGKVTNGSVSQDRIVVTTVCGHMYHHDCLNNWFKKIGKEAAWHPKNCPKCNTVLNTAKDIIRIFTSVEDDEGYSRDYYEMTLAKQQQNNKELEHRLEQYFLSIRALEKERMNLLKALEHEKSERARLEMVCNKLKEDNTEFQAIIINLNKAMAGSGQIPGMHTGYGHGHPRLPDPVMSPRYNAGMNYGYSNAMSSQHTLSPHASKPENGAVNSFSSGANPPSVSPRYQELGNDKKSLSTQLSNLLLGGGDDKESRSKQVMKRDKNDNDMDRRHGNHLSEEPPTDEVMDAILRANPQVVSPDEDNSAPLAFRPTMKPPIRINDSEKKLYGKFRCNKCDATWGNARISFEEPQMCMKCNSLVLPYTQEPVRAREEVAPKK